MATPTLLWTVLPHGPIEKLTENLWRVEGTLPAMALRRVMTCARLGDGRVVVHSAIALEDRARIELEGWGPPAFLLVPNRYHRLDVNAFKERYPAALVLCPEGARAKVAQRVPVDGTYEDFPADDRVSLVTLVGVRKSEGAVIVRSTDGTTLVVNDLIFHMGHVPGLAGWILRHVTASTGEPKISRLFRWLTVKDRVALRR